jgi:formate dehydrogenase iron-sulfur subunit
MTPRTQATPAATPPPAGGTPQPAATPVAAGATPRPVGTPPAAAGTGQPVAASTGSAYTPPGAFPAVPMGFFTDTTVCIGCKACEVACKQWNGLPADLVALSGDSYDNTLHLSGENWRHVKFIEQFPEDRSGGRWLMMSDVCKHCVEAGCLEVCPTGAIIRTEYDTVVIQADVCNGCRNCIAACPFGVIEINPLSRTAMKCTLCYDRLQDGLPPACAQACPTASIKFDTIANLHQAANDRLQQLNQQAKDAGQPEGAYLYGADDSLLGGLNSFYLLVDKPEVYGLPATAKLPSKQLPAATGLGVGGALGVAALGVVAFRKRRMDAFADERREGGEAAGGSRQIQVELQETEE